MKHLRLRVGWEANGELWQACGQMVRVGRGELQRACGRWCSNGHKAPRTRWHRLRQTCVATRNLMAGVASSASRWWYLRSMTSPYCMASDRSAMLTRPGFVGLTNSSCPFYPRATPLMRSDLSPRKAGKRPLCIFTITRRVHALLAMKAIPDMLTR